jgi:hypothetical protein
MQDDNHKQPATSNKPNTARGAPRRVAAPDLN